MRIALLLDNPERDLPGLALVATRLAAEGATTYLVPMNLAEPELGALAPDLVLLNYLRRTNEDLAGRLQDAGVRTAVLDTEGGVMDGFEPYARIMAQEPEVRRRVRRFLTWGPRLAEEIRRAEWYPDRSIGVTGQPRFDFYAEPWRTIAAAETRPRIDHLVDPSAPVVLIAGTFTLANPRFSTPERERRMLIEQLGLDPAYVEHRLACERRAMEGLSRLACRIAARRPELSVVLRPHPFEDEDGYRALVGEQEGVAVIRGGPILPWLLRSRALVQRGSTTAIEAALAGVPVLQPTWLPAWARLEAVDAASRPCGDAEELLERLDDVLAAPPTATGRGGSFGNPDREILDRWFAPVDGEAHARVASTLLEAAIEDGPETDARACRRLHYRLAAGAESQPLARLGARLRSAAGLPRSFSFRRFTELPPRAGWESSGKAFDADTVARWVEVLSPAVDPELRPTVRPARDTGAYSVPYRAGRSVEVRRG